MPGRILTEENAARRFLGVGHICGEYLTGDTTAAEAYLRR